MPLFKFCEPEHNPHRGSKLQVGTLFGYRTIEHDDLRDEGEGKYAFRVEFPDPIELDSRWANLLLQGAVAFGSTEGIPRFPGRFQTKIERLHLLSQKDGKVTVTDTLIRVEREVLDCLVFCMSRLDSVEECTFPRYKDQWSLDEGQADEFSRRLAALIFHQTKLACFDSEILTVHSPGTISSLSIVARHGPVRYRERHLRITKADLPTFEDLVATFRDVAFVKPETYANEREYRFVFELCDSQRAYPPVKGPIRVDPNTLRLA